MTKGGKNKVETLLSLLCINEFLDGSKYLNFDNRVYFEHETCKYKGIALPCKHKKSRAKRKAKK